MDSLLNATGMSVKRICVFIVLLLLVACTSQQEGADVTTGDLFFSTVRLGSYYNFPDSFRVHVERRLDTTDLEDASGTDKLFYEMFNALKKENMLYKPFVDLHMGEHSYAKLYLDSADYDRVKKYKWTDLRNNGKKVAVKARTRQIGDAGFPLLYCVDLVELEVVDGETLPARSKFAIGDYL